VSIAYEAPRATRPVRGRLVAGVAAGLAQHLRLPVWIVRIGFVVLALAGGIGIVLYAAFWAVLPLDTSGTDADPSAARSADTARLLALAALVVGVGLLLAALGVTFASGAVIPVIVAVFGAALIWRQTDDEQRDAWSRAAGRAARQTAGTTADAGRWRIVIGISLVALAIIALLGSRTSPLEAVQGLAVAMLILGGIALVLFPWMYRAWRESSEQRRALIRSEERAEIAAHVHDSVLQTLTLIQRFSTDPAEVVRLARTEERNLRSWLYAPTGDPDRTFAAALEREAASIEADYSASIDVVTVGDAALNGSLGALVAASREAMVNAAKHGGAQASVYAECREDVAEVFIRDRGSGFDLEAIPEDRLGVRESVIGRMERNGGTATLRSTPTSGTEVHLRMPRATEATP
jgi:signal transduction histidine kinase